MRTPTGADEEKMIGFLTSHQYQAARRSTPLLLVALTLLIPLVAPSPASAVELPPYERDPVLSLTGNCAVSSVDPVPDPSCPYPAPPGGPVARFNAPIAVAIDSFGNEYVSSYAQGDPAKGRIDVFDDEGRFITGAAIARARRLAVDSKGNLYVFRGDGDILRYAPETPYEPESGGIKYEDPPVLVLDGSGLNGAVAVDDSNQQLLVALPTSITRYKSAEEGNGQLESFNPEGLGFWPNAITVDAQRRRIYTVTCKNGLFNCGVMVIGADAPHPILEELDGSTLPAGAFASTQGELPIAVDEESGDFFVADPAAKKAYQFDEDYEYLAQIGFGELLADIQIAVSNGGRSPTAQPCEYPDPENREVPAGDACNRHSLFIPLRNQDGNVFALRPPAQTPPVIEGVSTGEIGQSEAELRAEIFPGGLATEYAFEVTTEAAFEAEGFSGASVVGKGTISGGSFSTEVITNATGLTPGQAYRFRVLAGNELGGAAEEGQNEAAFSTYEDATSPGGCPNDSLRSGASTGLPDCRAYELVTPAETNGRRPLGVNEAQLTTVQASPSGGVVSFLIEGGSLPGTAGTGGFSGDPYAATRGFSGWTTALVGPTGAEATGVHPGSVSPDQGYSLWTALFEGTAVIGSSGTEYVRYPDGHSELVGRGSLATDPRARGRLITENGTHIVFETVNAPEKPVQLEPNAPPSGIKAVYDRTADEVTHVVSLLPGDVTPTQDAAYVGASADGEGIAFMVGNTLYLRVNNAVTHEIGTNVEYAGLAEGGTRIFYVEGDDLLAFDTGAEAVVEFSSTGDVTPVNVASEGSRAYFVSPSVLGGENPNGDFAQSGKQNLYLSEEGEISFLGTVTDRDVEGEPPVDGLGLWTKAGAALATDPSRLNPDGSVLLFQSRANLTGYDSGEFPQVYRYDSGASRLHCISCIPTKVPASGGASLQSNRIVQFDVRPLSKTSFVPNLTPDGKRVFFESKEALVSQDTDGVQDIYEWEEEGVGSCERPGGCVYLISSGRSAADNYLYAHSTDGRDVFFATSDILTSDDPSGTVSIYDARVNGGFAAPAPAGECLGEACQPVVSAPDDPTPTSASFRGEGNVKPPGKARRCPSGKRQVKRRGKVRCVKKQQRQRQRKRVNAKSGRTSK